MHGYRGKYWGWVMPLPKPRRKAPPTPTLSERTETPKALSGMGYGEGCSSGIRGGAPAGNAFEGHRTLLFAPVC